jgi:hypothetical protein
VDLRELARLRLRNQRVSGARLKSAQEVVGWLGCVQSQEYSLAKWSLGKRATGLVDADVDAALADGRILRTHILRPTWHFVLPSDIRWMMALTGPRVARVIRTTGDIVVPSEAKIQRALDVIRSELAGGKRMSRAQLTKLLIERGAATDEVMTIPVFMRAELDLVVASGGLVGKAQTYALLDETAPVSDGAGPPEFDRDWALGELTRRFFTSHGPAAIPDFTWWSSLTVADTKRGIEINGAEVERLDVDGVSYWWAGDVGGSGTDAGSGEPSPTAHLMQGYDEYVVAYRSPRTPINVTGLVPGSALSRPPFLHALILDTQLVGWWRRVTLSGGDGYRIETRLARVLTAREERALSKEVARHQEFVGVPVALANVEVAPGVTLASSS